MASLREERGSLRGLISGAVLLVLGGCLGLVLGSLLDAPRLLLHRLQGPVETVELPPPEPEPVTERREDLAEYRALQEQREPETPSPPAPRSKPAPPQVAAAPPQNQGARAEEAVRPQEPEADSVIRALANEHESPAASLPKPASTEQGSKASDSRVVQVGAYADLAAARAAVAGLRADGLDAYVSDQRAPGRYPYRVRVRPAAGESAAELSRELEGRGLEVWITRE